MISLPFRRPPSAPSIDALYGMIVAQARSPSFYRSYGVPDTVAGRLDMIVLHLVLLLKSTAAGIATAAGQRLFDRFCQDIDDNFREMGVGDLAVPKEMRRVAEAFFGRQKAYQAALASADPDVLAATVARNVFGLAEPPPGAYRLAGYMRETAHRLGDQGAGALTGATLDFPDPETIAAPRTQAAP